MESCRENYGMKYRYKVHKDRNRHKTRIKRSGQARLVYIWDINRSIPPREGEPAGTTGGEKMMESRLTRGEFTGTLLFRTDLSLKL